ncbi:hypothetical protein BDD12DRAFT_860056 [Trichophaea hybrida]|nr:hypothetical protein BDD12DRAFT_860056 [Trichophaea hybrida]
MGDVKLFCILQGDSLQQSFLVTIPRGDYVDSLKELIVAKRKNRLNGVDVSDLRFYPVSIAYDSELRLLNLENTRQDGSNPILRRPNYC